MCLRWDLYSSWRWTRLLVRVVYLFFHSWLHALVQVRKKLSMYYRCGVICLWLGAGSGSEFMYLSFASLYRFVLSISCHALEMLVKELFQVGVYEGR